jgi:hypothetical protein
MHTAKRINNLEILSKFCLIAIQLVCNKLITETLRKGCHPNNLGIRNYKEMFFRR